MQSIFSKRCLIVCDTTNLMRQKKCLLINPINLVAKKHSQIEAVSYFGEILETNFTCTMEILSLRSSSTSQTKPYFFAHISACERVLTKPPLYSFDINHENIILTPLSYLTENTIIAILMNENGN